MLLSFCRLANLSASESLCAEIGLIGDLIGGWLVVSAGIFHQAVFHWNVCRCSGGVGEGAASRYA